MNNEAIEERINGLKVIFDYLLALIEKKPITDVRGHEFDKYLTNALYLVTLELEELQELQCLSV
jgi:hypothetical protein